MVFLTIILSVRKNESSIWKGILLLKYFRGESKDFLYREQAKNVSMSPHSPPTLVVVELLNLKLTTLSLYLSPL